MRTIAIATVLFAACAGLAGCGGADKTDIVAQSPTAITITTSRFSEPTALAQAHCAKYGRKAVSRGGVKLGSPAYNIMWGFDCVDK